MAGGDYGRIRHTFWTDPDIKRVLSPEQKTLLLYFFTSPHRTLIGLYYCPLEYAAGETGLSLAQVREWTLGALSRFVTYDERTEEILVHRAGRHQVGEQLAEKDNQRKAIEKALHEAHSPRLVRKFLSLYAHWPLSVEAPPEPEPEVKEAPLEPLASPSEAKAVAVTEQVQRETLPNGSGGQAADEFFEVEVVDPGEDEPRGTGGAQVIPMRVRKESPITAETLLSVPERLTTWQVLGPWVKRQDPEPDAEERKRQGAAAKRLAERHSGRDIALAFLGMDALFEYSDGQPWDLFDLERKFSKAKQAAKNHPAVKEARMDAELDDALDAIA